MSLFDSLYRLLPSGQGCLEDFHTEIVAHVFQSFPDLALAWLREIGATKLTESDDFIVGTQEEYFALETHSTGSRPDIVIRIRNGECLERAGPGKWSQGDR